MSIFPCRAGLSFAVALGVSLLVSSFAVAADVSNGTALRHSGQIHTHRGHHANKKANPTAPKAPATTQGDMGQSGDESTR